jgi:hypothetical protein
MTTDELTDYYVSLLIVQYASLNNSTQTMRAIVKTLLQDQIVQQVQDAFDLNTAIGKQLDILGQFVGVSRNAFGLVPNDYWSLPSYSDTLPAAFFGWADYNSTPPLIVHWLQYNDLNGAAYTLTDNQMRRLIGLKAAFSTSGMGLGDIDNILYSYFGPYVNLLDNENMTIIYQHQIADPDPDKLWTVALLENALPHQAGVNVATVEV